MIVRDRDGAVLGHVLPVNGKWAHWRGAAPIPLRWAATREGAVAALLALTASPAARTNGREPIPHSHLLHVVKPAHLGDSRAAVPHHEASHEPSARQAGDARGASLLPIGRREMPEQRNPVDSTLPVSLPARRQGAPTGGTNESI